MQKHSTTVLQALLSRVSPEPGIHVAGFVPQHSLLTGVAFGRRPLTSQQKGVPRVSVVCFLSRQMCVTNALSY